MPPQRKISLAREWSNGGADHKVNGTQSGSLRIDAEQKPPLTYKARYAPTRGSSGKEWQVRKWVSSRVLDSGASPTIQPREIPMTTQQLRSSATDTNVERAHRIRGNSWRQASSRSATEDTESKKPDPLSTWALVGHSSANIAIQDSATDKPLVLFNNSHVFFACETGIVNCSNNTVLDQQKVDNQLEDGDRCRLMVDSHQQVSDGPVYSILKKSTNIDMSNFTLHQRLQRVF